MLVLLFKFKYTQLVNLTMLKPVSAADVMK